MLQLDARNDYLHKKKVQRTKNILISFFSTIACVFGLTLSIAWDFSNSILGLEIRNSIIIGTISFIGGLGFLLYVYLNSRPLYPYSLNENRYTVFENAELIKVFELYLKKDFIKKYGSLDPWNKEAKDGIGIFQDELDSYKQKIFKQTEYDLEYSHLYSDLSSLESKFKSQINRLVSNSNLNLIIGIITTVLAMIILGFSIFQSIVFKSTVELLSFFIPRISTVIFIELFSFFFLKLYKNNLAEIKYFQNEITNLNFKISALKTALKTQDKEALSKVISVFSIAERNFVLKKDETTEKLESIKIENDESFKYTKSFIDLLNTIKK